MADNEVKQSPSLTQVTEDLATLKLRRECQLMQLDQSETSLDEYHCSKLLSLYQARRTTYLAWSKAALELISLGPGPGLAEYADRKAELKRTIAAENAVLEAHDCGIEKFTQRIVEDNTNSANRRAASMGNSDEKVGELVVKPAVVADGAEGAEDEATGGEQVSV